MRSLLLILAVLVTSANAIFGPRPSAYRSRQSSCNGKTVPKGECAVLYDDENCGGWQVKK